MNRALILSIGLLSALALTASAAKPALTQKRTRPTKEQNSAMKELRAKYDKDNDGKLSKEERAAMSSEDKAKMKEFRTAHKKAKGK